MHTHNTSKLYFIVPPPPCPPSPTHTHTHTHIYTPTHNAHQAGIRLHRLNSALEELGLSLRNLGATAEQSIAGAIATGTHGTGTGLGSVSAQVCVGCVCFLALSLESMEVISKAY